MSPESTASSVVNMPRSLRHFSRRRQRSLRMMAGLTSIFLLSMQTPVFAADRFWQLGANGFWDVAANWGGSLPGTADDVYNNSLTQITHRSGTDTINRFRSLTASGGGGELIVSGGTLQINTQLDTDGNVTVANGATLRGQSAAATTFRVGGRFALNGGTLANVSVQNSNRLKFNYGSNILENVALDGSLDLSPENSKVRIVGTTSFGVNPSFNLGSGSVLSFQGDRTLDNTTVTATGIRSGSLSTQGDMTLTLPSTFRFTGMKGNLFSTAGTGLVFHSGQISQNVAGGGFRISPTEFHNLSGGIVQATGTNTFVSLTPQTFANTGTVEALNGGSVGIFPANSWNVTGTLRADGANSVLTLGGTFRLDTSNALTTLNGGLVNLGGTLDNTGRTFDVTADIGGTHNFRISNGRILGGNVTNSNLLRFGSYNNTLENVALDGSLDLSPDRSLVIVAGTTSFGANPTFNLGRDSSLYFQGDRTLNDTTITTVSDGQGVLSTLGNTHLTLPSTFRFTGRSGRISGNLVSNAGLISPNVSGGQFLLDPVEFRNLSTGILRAEGESLLSNGYGIVIAPRTFSNAGTIEALNGGNVAIVPTNLTLGGMISVDSIYSSLRILPTNPYTLAGTLSASNAGQLSLGGTFNVGAGTSLITNSNGIIYLSGTLDNTGRTFDVTRDIGGTHNFQMDNGRILGGSVTHSNLLRLNYGTSRFENVTLDSGLDLSPTGYRARIIGTTSFGANPTFNLGRDSGLIFQGDRTLADTTVTSNSDGYGLLFTDGATTLTLPSSFRFTGRYGNLGSSSTLEPGGVLKNSGFVSQNIADGRFNLGFVNLQNLNGGIIRADGSNTFVNLTPRTFSNAGTIEALNGGKISIDPRSAWNAAGTIRAAGEGSSVELRNTFTVTGAPFETVGAGRINLRGTLDNTGNTLNIGGSHNFYFADGTLLNGSVVGSNHFKFTGDNCLVNVALDDGLDLSPEHSRVRIIGSTSFGANPTFNLGGNSYLIFHGDRTLANTTVTVGSSASNYQSGIYTSGDLTLTLPSTFRFTGRNGFIGKEPLDTGNSIIENSGLIAADGRITIEATEFQNLSSGVVRADGLDARVSVSGFSSILNAGTIEAVNSGEIGIGGAQFTNSGIINVEKMPNVVERGYVWLGATTNINDGTIQVGRGSTLGFANLTQTGGSIRNDGTLESESGLLDIQGGILQSTGRISADVQNGGVLQLGDTTGFLTIAGNYTQTESGTLVIDINGARPGVEYDWLDVLRTGTLAGTLTVNLNYTPQVGTVYTIAGFRSSYSGTFDTLNMPSNLEILYNSNSIQLRAVPAPGSLIGLCMGMTGLAVILRRRRK